MKPRDRSINIFNLSMLDVISGALGAFLILVVVLLPYYKKEYIDYEAENRVLRHENESLRAELEASADEARRMADEARRRAEAAEALAREMAEALAEAEARLASLEDAGRDAEEARARAEALERRIEEMERLSAEARAAAEAAETHAREAERRAREAESRAQAAAAEADRVRRLVENLDIVFVFDATGSMRQEISDLRENMFGIVRVLQRLAKTVSVGFVAYRDQGEAYLTREFQLQPMTSAGLTSLQTFLNGIEADGGGDNPEAVDAGLEKALTMPWRTEVRQVIILIGDAPVHPGKENMVFQQATQFRTSGPSRAVSVIYATDDPNSEYESFFRQVARAGGGEFLASRGGISASVLLSVMEER